MNMLRDPFIDVRLDALKRKIVVASVKSPTVFSARHCAGLLLGNPADETIVGWMNRAPRRVQTVNARKNTKRVRNLSDAICNHCLKVSNTERLQRNIGTQ